MFIATAKWFCNCLISIRAADCVVKPRRRAASSALYALPATRMKTDYFQNHFAWLYRKNTCFIQFVGNCSLSCTSFCCRGALRDFCAQTLTAYTKSPKADYSVTDVLLKVFFIYKILFIIVHDAVKPVVFDRFRL